MLTVQLERPIQSAVLVEGCYAAAAAERAAAQAALAAEIERYRELCRTLEAAAARLNGLYGELFAAHGESIARLSTEIARKVLMRNISDGDYAIEAIVAATLKNAPDADDIVIRLNPQDLTDYRNSAGGAEMAGVELLADPAIGRGECVLESTKGIVKSLIDEHLERIIKALEKTDAVQ